MGLADLREVKHPKHEKRVCVACKSFVAECMVPVGEGAAPMCWLCAHHVVDHECALHEAMTAECECAPDQVYPVRVLQARAAAFGMAHGDLTYKQIQKGLHENGEIAHVFNPRTGEIERVVIGGPRSRRSRC